MVAEVLVAVLGADVAGVDAVLGERPRAGGILRQQEVAVVVEVADDRDVRPRGRCRAPPAPPRRCSPSPGRARCPPRRARAPARWCAATSAVSVLVMDWTTIGWQLPTWTPPTSTVGLRRRSTPVIGFHLPRVHFITPSGRSAQVKPTAGGACRGPASVQAGWARAARLPAARSRPRPGPRRRSGEDRNARRAPCRTGMLCHASRIEICGSRPQRTPTMKRRRKGRRVRVSGCGG